MNNFIITPKVDETQEFIEIANDFSNPLDLVRESISNSYDAGATVIDISFDVIKELGESILKITLSDNGQGMNQEQLQSFFDLGNSTKRNDRNTIGEKGHGTKVFFNSHKIEVKTSVNGVEGFVAVMNEPFKKLFNREIPTVNVEKQNNVSKGTVITIYGYNNNRREKFTHKILKDYIQWFTKHGSLDSVLRNNTLNVSLNLKGLGVNTAEIIAQGHYFPAESENIQKLFETYITRAPDFYCKRVVKNGTLKNYPEIEFQAIFSIEGKYVKYNYNEMLRRAGYSAPEGAYTIQERYGLWLCKDFIPVQRKNEWITYKGSEYTKFHAFVNCQDLRLTANRGSVENTPSEILQDLKNSVVALYETILNSNEWTSIEWLEEESAAYQSAEKEKKHFEWRINKIKRSNIADYKGVRLVEPERESGVFALFLILSQLEPNLFPFYIIDYDTHEGIDVIAKGDNTTPLPSAKLFYVEFKNRLNKWFNHSFEHLHSIICWDTDIKHDDVIQDPNHEERKFQIIQPENEDDYTRFFLENPRKAHRIEVYCLKSFLKEKLGIEFRPRTAQDAI